jgi:hypothetical protein
MTVRITATPKKATTIDRATNAAPYDSRALERYTPLRAPLRATWLERSWSSGIGLPQTRMNVNDDSESSDGMVAAGGPPATAPSGSSASDDLVVRTIVDTPLVLTIQGDPIPGSEALHDAPGVTITATKPH